MCPLMSVRPETRQDKILVANGQLQGMKRLQRSSPEEYRMLNGRVPDKERIKRSNDGCETVVHDIFKQWRREYVSFPSISHIHLVSLKEKLNIA